MNICLVAPHIRIEGVSGAAIHHREFSLALSKLGIAVYIVAEAKKEIKIEKNIFIYPSKISGIPSKRFFTSFFSVNKIIDICQRHRIDIIHDRCDPGQIGGYLAAKKLGLPRIAEVNENQLAYEAKGNFFRDVIMYPLLIKIKKIWIRNIVAEAEKIVAVSNTIKKSLIRQGIATRKIKVIHCGANPKKFMTKLNKKLRKKYNLDTHDIVIAIVGEMGPRQGIKESVKAIEKLKNKIPNVKLVLLGREKRYEKYFNSIKSYVVKKRLEKTIIFIDYIPHGKIGEFLSTIDITLAPYRESWNEESFGFSPIKIFEYMAAGKIVVATDTKWNREIITNGKNGFLIKLEKLETELEKIIKKIKNKKLRNDAEMKARESIEKKFNWDNVAKDYLKIYLELLRNKPKNLA